MSNDINKGYNVKLYRVYSTRCSSCGEFTEVQNADGWGLCGNCNYRWDFNKDRTVGRCVKCNITLTVDNWLLHDTKRDDKRDHPLVKEKLKKEEISKTEVNIYCEICNDNYFVFDVLHSTKRVVIRIPPCGNCFDDDEPHPGSKLGDAMHG